MKKLVLKLGASALAVLPIVAVASCSSTPAEVPNIDNEASKFEQSMVVKDTAKAMTTQEAVKSIESATSQEAKLAALGALIELPEMDSRFDHEVQSVLMDKPNNTSITVLMKIIEKSNRENIEISKLVITGLKASLTPLESEIKKFTISSPANNTSKTLKTSQVLANINNAEAAAKLGEVEKITTVPKPSAGFSIKILKAQDGKTSTSVDVAIQIIQEGKEETGEATFTITDLTALTPQEKLVEQANLLTSKEVVASMKGQTPLEASKVITSRATLDEYYAPITLEEGVFYHFKNSKVNEANKTILDVTIVLSDTDGTTLNKEIQLTGFRALTVLETEAAKLEVSLPAIDKTMKITTAFRRIAEAANEEAKKEVVKGLVKDFPVLGSGYTFIIDSAKKADNLKSIIISMTVSAPTPAGKDNRTTTNAIFTIIGLVPETSQQELERLSDLLINKDVPAAQGVETATLTAPKIATETLATYYPTITLAKDVTYAWKSSVAKGDVVEVTVTVTNTTLNIKMDKTFTLSGFKTQQKELEDQAKLLVTQPVLTDKASDTAIMAAKAIKDNDTLLAYYANVPMSQGITYNFVSATVNRTSVNVVVSVVSSIPNATTTPISVMIIITGFTSSQDKLSEQAGLLRNLPVLEEKAFELATVASAAITSTETLLPYYANVPMTEGISYEWVSDAVIGDTVEVVLKISSTEPGTNPIQRTITISGFRSQAQQDLIDQAELLVTQPVLSGKASETAISAAQLMNATNMVEYYAKVELATGITYAFGSARALGDTVELTVSVSSEAPHTTSIDKTIIITGFTTPQKKMAEQILLFTDQESLVKTGTAAQAKLAISNNDTLATYYTPVVMSHGITFNFKNSTINRDLNTTLNVVLEIVGQAGLKAQKTIQITGFMTPDAKLTEEAKKFINAPSIDKTVTAQMASESINDVETLAAYYAKVTTLEPGIKYVFTSAAVNKTDNTILDVTLTLSDIENIAKKVVVVQVSEFRAPTAIEIEASKFAISKVATDAELHTTTAMRRIKEPSTQEEKLVALKALVTGLPQINDTLYTMTIDGAVVNPQDDSSIFVSIIISAKNAGEGDAIIKPATARLTITGLVAETNEEEMTRLAREILTNASVPENKQHETVGQAYNNIITGGTQALEAYYPTRTIAKGISYKFKFAIPDGNWLRIVVTLTNSADTSISVDHSFLLNGLSPF